MRSVLTLGFALLGTAAALVHCAAAGQPDEAAAPGAEAGSAETSTDGAATSEASADTGAPSDGGPLPRCSPDHWCREPLPTPDFDVTAVWSFAPNDAFAVGQGGMVHWDGKTWSRVPSADGGAVLEGLSRFWSSGPNELWAIAQGQRRLVHGTRAAAGGTFTWTSSEGKDDGPTRDHVTGLGANDVWTAGILNDGTPMLEHLTSTDGGVPSFTPIAVPNVPFTVYGLFVTAGDEVWVAGNDDLPRVLHLQKKGNQYVWDESLAVDGGRTSFTGIWGLAANELWVLGSNGANYHRAPLPDGGGAWAPADSHAAQATNAVWGTSTSNVWVAGYFGAIRHWNGAAWSVSQIAVNGAPIYEHLFDVHGSSADDVWAVGPGVTLHRTPDGGP